MDINELKKLLSQYKPYKKELFLDLLCSVVHSLAVTLLPLLVKFLISDVINYEKSETYKSLILNKYRCGGAIHHDIFVSEVHAVSR